jgi:hypothetical protein
MEHHLAVQIECSMVGLREILINTTIIEEIHVDPMEMHSDGMSDGVLDRNSGGITVDDDGIVS